MRLAFLNYHYDTDLQDCFSLIERYHSTTAWSESVRKAGADSVTVMQRFRSSCHMSINGVAYHFVDDGLPHKLPWYANPRVFHALIGKLNPDIIHYNGNPSAGRFLRKAVGPRIPIVWQHHGGGLPTGVAKWWYRHTFHVFDAFLFSASDLGWEWKNAGIVRPDQPVFEILEASSLFKSIDQEAARLRLLLEGREIFLWVGRLNQNKDPITVLRAFATVAKDFVDPHIYFLYGDGDLLADVEAEIKDLGIAKRVHLLGHVDRTLMPEYYSAADYFVLGSHHEGSGFALLEALACGLAPIVTSIPSFRKMLSGSTLGPLWNAGDISSLVEAIRQVRITNPGRTSIRNHFERHLSYENLGMQALAIYRSVISRKSDVQP